MIGEKTHLEIGRNLRRAIKLGPCARKSLELRCLEDALLLTSSVQKPFSVVAL